MGLDGTGWDWMGIRFSIRMCNQAQEVWNVDLKQQKNREMLCDTTKQK